jgi:hypothetical protein
MLIDAGLVLAAAAAALAARNPFLAGFLAVIGWAM